jgi:hypothetical protein
MIRSAITVSLVPEASGGPFVYWHGLQDAFARASKLGFHAIEIFPPDGDAINTEEVASLCIYATLIPKPGYVREHSSEKSSPARPKLARPPSSGRCRAASNRELIDRKRWNGSPKR